jgi:hypothetical protein
MMLLAFPRRRPAAINAPPGGAARWLRRDYQRHRRQRNQFHSVNAGPTQPAAIVVDSAMFARCPRMAPSTVLRASDTAVLVVITAQRRRDIPQWSGGLAMDSRAVTPSGTITALAGTGPGRGTHRTAIVTGRLCCPAVERITGTSTSAVPPFGIRFVLGKRAANNSPNILRTCFSPSVEAS